MTHDLPMPLPTDPNVRSVTCRRCEQPVALFADSTTCFCGSACAPGSNYCGRHSLGPPPPNYAWKGD